MATNNNNSPQSGVQFQSAANPNRKGTGFTNLQKIVGANQNNQLGSAIKTGVGNSVNNVKAGLNQAQTTFNQGVESNRLDTDANKAKVSSVLQNVGTVNDDDINQFNTFRAGEYKGPNALSGVDLIKNQASEVQNSAKSGSDALLQRYVGGNQYTSGQRRLDNLILGQTAGDAVSDVRRQTAGLGGTIGAAETNAAAQAQMAANQAKQFAQSTVDQTNAVYDPLNTGLDTRVNLFTDADAARTDKANSVLNLLNATTVRNTNGLQDANSVTTDYQAAYGAVDAAVKNGLVSPEAAQKLTYLIPTAQYLGVNPKDLIRDRLFSQDSTNLDRMGLASVDERTKLDNLKRLLGGSTEFYKGDATVANQDRKYENIPQATMGQSGIDAQAVERTLANEVARLGGKANPYANSQVASAPTETVAISQDVQAQQDALNKMAAAGQVDPSTLANYQAKLDQLKTLSGYASGDAQRYTRGMTNDVNWIEANENSATPLSQVRNEVDAFQNMYGDAFGQGVQRNLVNSQTSWGDRIRDMTDYGAGQTTGAAQGVLDSNITGNFANVANLFRHWSNGQYTN